MTINKVIERVSRLKPNAVEDRDIASWILQLDGQLYHELKMPEMVPISTYPDLLPEAAEEAQELPNANPSGPLEPQEIPATELLVPFRRPLKWPEDGDVELVVPAPYDGLYELYAVAKIEFYQREYSNYNNTILLYLEAVTEFRRDYRRNHHPQAWYIDTGGGGRDDVSPADPLHFQ